MTERLSPLLTGAALAVYCLAARAAMPASDGPTKERCDVIERNTVYTYEGTETFTQWIFWSRGQVRGWRFIKSSLPLQRDFERGGYLLRWHDGEVFREIRALSYEESHTQYDPEVEARSETPKERRKELLRATPAP